MTTPTTTQPTTIQPTTAPHNKALVIGGSVAAVAALAGVVTAIMLAFGGSAAGAHPAPKPVPASTPAPAPASKPTPTPSHSSGHSVTPITPPAVLPAAQVQTLQRELAQLNYYEGPINGVMTPETVESIKYLQRDAQLPQNGEFNQVTYIALHDMLANGNNQMGG